MKLSLALLLLAATPAFADDEATAPAAEESSPPRAKTGSFTIGAGYNSDDGFIAHAEVAQRDLFHTGQLLSLQADLSAVRQRFAIVHEVPELLGSGLDLRSELYSTRRTYPGHTREATGGAVTLGRRLTKTTRIFARYRIEHVGVELAPPEPAGAAARAMPGIGTNLGEGLYASFGAGLEYNTLDSPFLARHGTRLALFAERADRRFGSDHELWRATGSLDHARPLGPFTLRLHGHATLVRSRDPMGVPLAFRLFHEGHASVRGYALEDGGRLGDNAEAIGRAELELPVIKKAGLSIAGFAEAGLRFNSDSAWGVRDALLQRSVGLSVIWRSPIGPLRFDWALPLDGEKRGLQFLFGVGSTF